MCSIGVYTYTYKHKAHIELRIYTFFFLTASQCVIIQMNNSNVIIQMFNLFFLWGLLGKFNDMTNLMEAIYILDMKIEGM